MAITYGASAGTKLLSAAMDEALGSQIQQTGNNTVVVSDLLSVIGNGNIGSGTLGVGDSYLKRRVIINIGGTEQERKVIADVAGTGTTRILTVHEDWDVNPVSTDTIHVSYQLADILEGGAGGGISFATKTGLWTLTRILTIGNGIDIAFLAMDSGEALEQADRSAADSFLVENNGYFRLGYYSGGQAISGGVMAITAATNDEPAQTFAAGSNVAILDSLIWAQVANLSQISSPTAKVVYEKTKLLKATLELELYGDTLKDVVIAGSGGATEKVLVDANTVMDGAVISDVNRVIATGGTPSLKNATFVGVPDYVEVNGGGLVLVNVSWDVLDYTDLTFTTGHLVYEDSSLDVKVQKADGTVLPDSVVSMYEGLNGDGLFQIPSSYAVISDASGEVSGSFAAKLHTNAATTLYGNYALQIGKWLYLSFVAAQDAATKFDGPIVLSIDQNIIETNQANALANGSGITLNEDTNPSEIIEFNTGSGTLADGMIITFAPSGAVGTITTLMSGDSVAGEMHLNARNAVAIANGDTFSRTGGTAGTFSGTYVADSAQKFTKWIDGQSKSYQQIYEYFAAVTTDVAADFSITTYIGRLILEWCRDQQAQLLYNTGSSFKTERSYGKGVVIVNAGAGSIDYFTDDAGLQWTPPSSVTLAITVSDKKTLLPILNAQTSIHLKDSPFTELLNVDTNASGLATSAYTGVTPVDIVWKSRKSEVTDDPRYYAKSGLGTIESNGFTLDVALEQNPFI